MNLAEKLGVNADEMRRVTARLIKQRQGRRGLPFEIVEAMHRDYVRLNSLARTAQLWGRSRQSIWDIFHTHGLAMRARTVLQRIERDGRVYTPGKNGYFRCTIGAREPLHHRIWMDSTGRGVPQGWQITFKDGDNTNFALGNLACRPIAEVTRLHYERRFPKRARLSKAEMREFWRAHNRDWARRRYHARQRKNSFMRGNAAWRALGD